MADSELKIGSEEHREYYRQKEQERLDYLREAFTQKHGPEANKVIDKAMIEILEQREPRAFEVLEEIFTEKYGPEVHELIEKALTKLMIEREPRNIMKFAEVVTEKYGPEAFDVMRQAFKKMWFNKTKKLLDELEIKERDAIAAVKIDTFVHRDMGEVIEATPKRAVREERWCPHQDIFTPEFCLLTSGAAFEGVCEAINPKLVSRYEKVLTRPGDDCCRLVFELRD